MTTGKKFNTKMENSFAQVFVEALRMLMYLDADVPEIVGLSRKLSLTVVVLAAIFDIPDVARAGREDRLL